MCSIQDLAWHMVKGSKKWAVILGKKKILFRKRVVFTFIIVGRVQLLLWLFRTGAHLTSDVKRTGVDCPCLGQSVLGWP